MHLKTHTAIKIAEDYEYTAFLELIPDYNSNTECVPRKSPTIGGFFTAEEISAFSSKLHRPKADDDVDI